MTETVAQQATRRKITRLCHLTPLRNLLHIATEGALRSTAELDSDERAAFDQQDLLRLDRHPDHICCSVQYPNIWYLRRKRQQATPLQRLFPGWVCLLIDPSYLWVDGSLFCHRNAAAGSGAYLASGPEAFASIFADPVDGAGGPVYRDQKPDSCPTDDQSEVLVPKRIPLEHACEIVVADEAQARATYVGLELIGAPVRQLRWVVAPELFNPSL
ncbi:MAG: DarT ssDNA thymidine ADP-ribosyltransferase family protein, partial [Solirubrobacteraceae bacterium]